MVEFTLDIRPDPSGYMVTMAGDLDMASAPTLLDRTDELDLGPAAGEVTLDLGDLRFCDSAGINSLVRLRRRCDRAGWGLRTLNAQPAVWRTLVDVTGLGEFLNMR
jgi:anti-sigma B factor antagonist